MNKSTNKAFFNILAFILMLFFIETTRYWYSRMDFDDARDYDTFVLYVSHIQIYLMLLVCVTKKVPFSGVDKLLIAYLISILLVVRHNGGYDFTLFPNYVFWPLLFLSINILLRFDPSLMPSLRTVFFLFFIVGVIFFCGSLLKRGFGRQTNMVYFAVLPIPLLMLNNNKRSPIVLLIIATFISILSMKRSMLLAISLVWLFVFCSNFFKKGNLFLTILLSCFLVILLYVGVQVVNNLSGGYFLDRFAAEDVSNGRDSIYEETLMLIANSSFSDLIFGHGHWAVALDSISEHAAHNDFLEMVYDYGGLTLFVYICFFAYVIRKWIYLIRMKSKYIISYTLSVCLYVVMSMVSMLVLYNSYFNYLVIYWAAVEAIIPGVGKRKIKIEQQKSLIR